LSGREKSLIYQLSGGEQQRVALAGLMLKQPSLILADEPTGVLDAENEAQVLDILRELVNAGACAIIATHSDAVADFCDRRIDMSQFCNSKRLCCWAGLTPSNNESAGKKKSVRITRAGVYLKPALVQCAHAAVKSDKSPYYKTKYESLVKRRGKKRAVIAIARMILTAIYRMLSTGEVWNPSDLYKIDMPAPLAEKQKAKAIKQAKKLLQKEGLLPPDEPLAS